MLFDRNENEGPSKKALKKAQKAAEKAAKKAEFKAAKGTAKEVGIKIFLLLQKTF